MSAEKITTATVPVETFEHVRDQLHIMATNMVPNFCDMAAGLQGQVKELIDAQCQARYEAAASLPLADEIDSCVLLDGQENVVGSDLRVMQRFLKVINLVKMMILVKRDFGAGIKIVINSIEISLKVRYGHGNHLQAFGEDNERTYPLTRSNPATAAESAFPLSRIFGRAGITFD